MYVYGVSTCMLRPRFGGLSFMYSTRVGEGGIEALKLSLHFTNQQRPSRVDVQIAPGGMRQMTRSKRMPM